MKTIFLKVLTVLLVLIGFSGANLFAANNGETPIKSANTAVQSMAEHKLKWLLVLHASQGKLEQEKDGLYLKLSHVSKNMVAFTDRPNRRYRAVKTVGIINNWDKIFTQTSGGEPNAIVTHAEFATMSEDIMPEGLILSAPKMVDEETVTFKVASLDRQKQTFVPGNTYIDVNVFLDDANLDGIKKSSW
ncbi:MAG: hypothetical protein AAGA27_07345 [Pseudomonadota bacterium]